MIDLIPNVSASDLIASLGRDEVRAKLFPEVPARRARKTISQAVWMGSFPASWYIGMKQVADEIGVPCPQELFRFRPMRQLPKAVGQ